jgi:hypothetical protein
LSTRCVAGKLASIAAQFWHLAIPVASGGSTGLAYNKFGTHGLLWTDATPKILVFAIVLTVFVIHGVSLQRSHASRALRANTSR